MTGLQSLGWSSNKGLQFTKQICKNEARPEGISNYRYKPDNKGTHKDKKAVNGNHILMWSCEDRIPSTNTITRIAHSTSPGYPHHLLPFIIFQVSVQKSSSQKALFLTFQFKTSLYFQHLYPTYTASFFNFSYQPFHLNLCE